jgi:hypothetical protein
VVVQKKRRREGVKSKPTLFLCGSQSLLEGQLPNHPFSLGVIIAERHIAAFDECGTKRVIAVLLGAPVQVEPSERFPLPASCCPLQVEGLDLDGKVYPVLGGDAFEAMQYAINFAGELLKDGYGRLRLENRTRTDSTTPDHWIWRYAAAHD